MGATITASNAAGLKKSVVSDDWGNFEIKDLAPGNYSLSISANGFKLYEVATVTVKAEEAATLNAALEPGSSEAAPVNAQNQPASAAKVVKNPQSRISVGKVCWK